MVTPETHPMRTFLITVVLLFVAVLTLVGVLPSLFVSQQRVEYFAAVPKRLLAVFAHADDEVTNAALLRHFSTLGTEITLLTLTDGAANPKSNLKACLKGEGIVDCRLRELKSSAALLGVDKVETPLLPDSKLLDHLTNATEHVAALIKALEPDALLTMEPSGLNRLEDHRAAYLSVARALPLSGRKPKMFLSTLPWPFSFVLPTRMPRTMAEKKIVFPISDKILPIKIQVALAHKSQSSTIRGITLGLGPQFLFRWIDFETYYMIDGDEFEQFNRAKPSL
jgi:LmbE family N-acetylglucosaminyl deacetylase